MDETNFKGTILMSQKTVEIIRRRKPAWRIELPRHTNVFEELPT